MLPLAQVKPVSVPVMRGEIPWLHPDGTTLPTRSAHAASSHGQRVGVRGGFSPDRAALSAERQAPHPGPLLVKGSRAESDPHPRASVPRPTLKVAPLGCTRATTARGGRVRSARRPTTRIQGETRGRIRCGQEMHRVAPRPRRAIRVGSPAQIPRNVANCSSGRRRVRSRLTGASGSAWPIAMPQNSISSSGGCRKSPIVLG